MPPIPIPPNQAQQRASHPHSSVWVQAHAGSGKTKVLVDRVLRILLEGVDPSHIVCITYTKAAATEMHVRILARLRAWVRMPEAQLIGQLSELRGDSTGARSFVRTARQLYLRVLDAPMGLRIHTIHALCEQILAQFPNEAGIAPHVRVMEDQESQTYLQRAMASLMRDAFQHPTGALYEAIQSVMEAEVSAYSFAQLMHLCIQQRRHMAKLLATNEGLETTIEHLYDAVQLPRDVPLSEVIPALLQWDKGMHHAIVHHVRIMHTYGGITAQKHAQQFFAWLEAHPSDAPISLEAWEVLVNIPLTEKKTIRQTMLTKSLRKDYEATTEWLDRFFEQCMQIDQLIARAQLTRLSHAVMICAAALYQHYEQMKAAESCVDFDDLILLTRRLLEETHDAAWVMHKLDGTITHLLIDEAQDTSADQWAITQQLCEGMFQMGGYHEHGQYVFVVGDSKQSIYAFQGADPHFFLAKRTWYHQLACEMEHPWDDVPLATSFRSTQAVLDVVDALCATLPTHEEPHHAFRVDQAGCVILYPLVTTQEHSTLHHRDALAQMIADQVAQWLRDGRTNPATGATIQAGDILILVQQRNRTLYALDRALRHHGIPTAGLDRVDTSHLAIRDMTALLQWLCDAHDDAALAVLLTSPLYAVDDDALCALCAPRMANLWEALQQDVLYAPIVEELAALRKQADYGVTPLALLYHLCYARAGMARMVARMGDIARDVLEHMLYALERYEAQEAISMQGCVAWLQEQAGTSKRDLDDANHAIRLMTVHGSKGLEAPIVIIADMIGQERGKRTPALVVHTHHHVPLLLMMGQAGQRQGIFADAHQAYHRQQEEELQRLLYVALTRARDEVHMFGAVRSTKMVADNHSWYAQMQRVMGAMQGVKPYTIMVEEGAPYHGVGEGYHYVLGEPATPTRNEAVQHEPSTDIPLWMTTPRMSVPSVLQWHAPSNDHVAEQEQSLFYDTAVQGVGSSDASQRARGILLHRCLQKQTGMHYADFLHGLPALLLHLAPEWSDAERQALIADLAQLATNTPIRTMLEAPAISEWGVMGMVDGTAYSGVVDRVIMRADGWIVLEIKTGMMPDPDSVRFRAHCRQVQHYQALIRAASVHQPVRGALLYTQSCTWVDVP